MAHSYSHLWNLPTTMFRFFTVYGPWGRPDMALFKFTKNILSGEPIDVYNRGNMFRDFTYVEDLATAVAHLIDVPPNSPAQRSNPIDDDSLSPVAPYRIVNIGNSDKIRLMDFIEELEIRLGKKSNLQLYGYTGRRCARHMGEQRATKVTDWFAPPPAMGRV